MSKAKAQNATTTRVEKTDLFDRVADALGFETTANGRKPRFRYGELSVLYDHLHDLGVITTPRGGDEVRAELRGTIADGLGFDEHGGRPLTKPEVWEIARVFDANDVVPDGGSGGLMEALRPNEDYPTADDLERAGELELTQPWNDPEECVCVSRKQNSTRYHTLWTVKDDDLVPVCKGYCPGNNTPHRLAPEASIKRTKDECDYCKKEDLRL